MRKALFLGVALLLAGCGETEAKPVPDLRGDVETYDDDDDVPLVEHLWEVCYQDPSPGARGSYVELYVDRDC
jgi:hypothetical protein